MMIIIAVVSARLPFSKPMITVPFRRTWLAFREDRFVIFLMGAGLAPPHSIKPNDSSNFSTINYDFFFYCLCSALDKIIVQGYKALQLEYFFTAGPDEVKAWTIQVRKNKKSALMGWIWTFNHHQRDAKLPVLP